MPDVGYYKLPLDEEHLILLGRQARACGGIELVTRWLRQTFIDPSNVQKSATRIRRLSHYVAVEKLREVAPHRIAELGPVARFHVERNMIWLDEARAVVQKRNDYLHGFWLAPEEEPGVAAFWDQDQQRIEVPLDALRADTEYAETVERGGVSVLTYTIEALGVPRVRS